MSSRIMMVLAAVLAVGSIALLFYGTRLGREAPTVAEVVAQNQPPVPEPPKEVDVVAVAVDLPRGHVLVPEDLTATRVVGQGVGQYVDPQPLAGEITRVPIAAGTVLTPEHLVGGGNVARSLFPGERAVAVQVNEVIGAGGFIQPEDYVDVLLYLKGRFEQVEQSQAQVVLRKVRVLALGDTVVEDPVSEPPPQPVTEDEGPGVVAQASEAIGATPPARNARQTDEDRNRKTGKRSQSAVLAVSEADATRLMLAASTGELRLALLPTEEGAVVTAGPVAPVDPVGLTPAALAARKARQQAEQEAALRRIELEALIGKNRAPSAPSAGAGRRRGSAAPAGATMVIHRGDAAERVAVGR